MSVLEHQYKETYLLQVVKYVMYLLSHGCVPPLMQPTPHAATAALYNGVQVEAQSAAMPTTNNRTTQRTAIRAKDIGSSDGTRLANDTAAEQRGAIYAPNQPSRASRFTDLPHQYTDT